MLPKCNNTDKICERPDNGCYCDNIAIYREDEGLQKNHLPCRPSMMKNLGTLTF